MQYSTVQYSSTVVYRSSLTAVMAQKLTALLLFSLAGVLPALGANPFSSNVVELTPKNWKQLEKSPHVWFVNICRQG